MKFDVDQAISHARRLSQDADTLRDLKNSMEKYKGNIAAHWQATEVMYINDAIDHLSRKFYTLSQKLDEIGEDIVLTAHEIRNEEIEKEKAAADAAAAKSQ
ncbi:hypothetical protein BABA_14427 [Neobacillus bataviensis LMG 21833]|uniref:ESAT-6-like protein n=1 Tax=Neobacillus bataviensis LMG 21833 TaxID=1117379 RepID=K6E0H8_9BACI|nr:WXG100 family type VII secretion target [Neobacillus bataviensis]EKN66661.1 hypothetical protein BABA_14427 [Neobacillus bataviensis LMG 21833]